MKDINRLFTNLAKNCGINFSLLGENNNQVAGDFLPDEQNLFFDFLYKGEKMHCVIEGRGENSLLAKKILKSILDYKESFIIKSKSDYLLKTLLGVAGSKTQTVKYKINLKDCVTILIKSEGYSSQIYDLLSVYSESLPIKIDKNLCALIIGKTAEEDYLSFTKFAKILSLAIQEELGIKVKIGVGNSVENFEDINKSYLQAKNALEMGEVVAEKNIYSYLEVLPIKIISLLNGKEKAEFLKPFKQILKNEQLSVTAQEFLNCGLNANLASEKLFVHRNTLNYRLNKIEKQVGLDLRNFNDAVTFRMVCLIYKLKEKNE